MSQPHHSSSSKKRDAQVRAPRYAAAAVQSADESDDDPEDLSSSGSDSEELVFNPEIDRLTSEGRLSFASVSDDFGRPNAYESIISEKYYEYLFSLDR